MSTTYRARIIRADDSGLWVSVPALGDAEFGPLESIVSDIIIKPKYTVGDRVIIEQIGSIPEDFIVVGIAARTIGAPPDWSLRNIDASQVVSGVLDPRRMAHIRSDSSTRAWFTTNVDGGWGGDSTALVLSPPTDASWTSALELRVNNLSRFAVSKDGVLTAGTVPADHIDKFSSAANYTNLLATANSVTQGWVFQLNNTAGTAGLIYNNAWKVQWDPNGVMTHGTVPAARVDKMVSDPSYTYLLGRANGGTANNTALLADAGNGNTGGLVNGSYVWRFDSSGTLVTGTIPTTRLSGFVGYSNLPHIVANQSATPPYAIFGVQQNIGYDTPTTALQMGDFSGTSLGTRARIYDAARKVLFQLNRDSAGDYAAAQAFYDRTTTAAANVQVGTSGALSRSTSLRSAKVSIEDAPESWTDKVWSLAPRTWFDKTDADLLADALARQSGGEEVEWDGVLASPLRRIPGFVAEEVEEVGLEEFLVRDETGELSGLAYDRFSAALLMAMKDERQKRIDLEARVGTLLSRIEALEGGVEA